MNVISVRKHSSDFFIGAFVVALIVSFVSVTPEGIAGAIDRTLGAGGSGDANEEQFFSFIFSFHDIFIYQQVVVDAIRVVDVIPKLLFILQYLFRCQAFDLQTSVLFTYA